MAENSVGVPHENLAIYQTLYRIEVGLREFIIEVLSSQFGGKWWKQRLPPDVFNSSKEGLESERNIRWWHLIPHHPMYYTDFPDLRKVIMQKNNWDDAFKQYFGSNKVLIDGMLSSMEPIRNKVAHNRRATIIDKRIIDGVYEQIASIIGRDAFERFIRQCTTAPDICIIFEALLQESMLLFSHCKSIEVVGEARMWQNVTRDWWFDAEYLGVEVSGIEAFFEVIAEYSKIPRERGSGHRIEAWIREHEVQAKYDVAMNELRSLLNERAGVN